MDTAITETAGRRGRGRHRAAATEGDSLGATVQEPSRRYSDGKSALADIGRRLVEARRVGKLKAWRQIFDDLASNLDLISYPDGQGFVALNLKDALAMLRECEEFIKGSDDAGQQNPMALLSEWLSKEQV